MYQILDSEQSQASSIQAANNLAIIATGGECWTCYSHSSYYAEIPSQYLMNAEQTYYVDAKGSIVNDKDKVRNAEWDAFTDMMYAEKTVDKNLVN